EPVRATRVRDRRQHGEKTREQPTTHGLLASLPSRTVLLCSGDPEQRSPELASLTWLGHAAFRLDTDGGKRIYVDPFLTHNPKTPEAEKQPERVDVIALTHGHGDHVGDTVELSKRFPDAEIVAIVELKGWLGQQGANVGDLPGINKGGTQAIDGVRFTLTNAF